MAIDYSGTGQYHVTTTTPVTGVPITIAAWFNSDNDADLQALATVCDSAGSLVHFGLVAQGGAAGDPIYAWAESVSTAGIAESTTGYTAGVWHHGCAVFTSTTSRAAYIDGGSKGTNTTNTTPGSIDRIGLAVRADDSPTALLDGRLAEVGIWNVALTDAEVAVLAQGYAPPCVRRQSLVFYAPLVREVQDVRGGRTLTATGSPTVGNHCRIIYPHKRIVVPFAAAAAGGDAVPQVWSQYRRRRIA
jgi:hypothetical protein